MYEKFYGFRQRPFTLTVHDALAGNVAPVQGERQGQGLDRGAAGETRRFEAGQQAGMQFERVERDVGQGLVAHGFLYFVPRGQARLHGGRPASQTARTGLAGYRRT